MWNRAAPAGTEVTGYEVYRGRTKVEEVPVSTHMVDVTRLRPATTYVFTVRARDADGRLGPPSREVRATTPAAVRADTAPPTVPGGVKGRAAGSRAAQLSWTAARDDRGVVSYDIYQGRSKIHSVGGNQTAAVVTGLRPGTRYVFSVRARDAADNLSPASPAVRLSHRGRHGQGRRGHGAGRLPRDVPPFGPGVRHRPDLDAAARRRDGRRVRGAAGRTARHVAGVRRRGAPRSGDVPLLRGEKPLTARLASSSAATSAPPMRWTGRPAATSSS
ncbi:hypothetical protein SALBM217S_06548 [Streptomyces griseoloalbus]